MLSEAEILGLLREFLWATVVMSMPLLVTALVVGIAIGLFQALTSIQELTLTFVPKAAAMAIVFWATAGFMIRICINLFDNQIIPIVGQ